jgi:hypothetical protein
MSGMIQISVLILGAIFAVTGIALFAKRGVSGQNTIKIAGIELQLAGSSLVVFVVGCGLIVIAARLQTSSKDEANATPAGDDSVDLATVDPDLYKPVDPSSCPAGDPDSLRSKVVGDWVIKTDNSVKEYPVTLTDEELGYTSQIPRYGRGRGGNPINQPFFAIDSHGASFPTGRSWIFFNGAIVFNRDHTGRPVKMFRCVSADRWDEVPIKHVHAQQHLTRPAKSSTSGKAPE